MKRRGAGALPGRLVAVPANGVIEARHGIGDSLNRLLKGVSVFIHDDILHLHARTRLKETCELTIGCQIAARRQAATLERASRLIASWSAFSLSR